MPLLRNRILTLTPELITRRLGEPMRGKNGGDLFDSRSTHRLTLRAQASEVPGTRGRVTADQRLGGLQGRRTAVRDVDGNSALKESPDHRRDGLLGKCVSARDEAKGEGR
jgi:hypothetical protein